ncbi:MAG: molybdopterin cofactor-binding domain-containing protein, partial [Marmoricola sp.]
MSKREPTAGAEIDGAPVIGPSRRSVVGYLVAAPTLAVAVRLGIDTLATAAASVPSIPGPADLYDLNTMLTDATLPTANRIMMVVNTDGTVDFALPRAEVGQGITTSTAMLIADEMDTPLSTVNVTLADARPELIFNQLTGGSNTTISTYRPIRAAAAAARQALVQAAAKQWGVPASTLTTSEGYVINPSGAKLSYGSLAAAAAVPKTVPVGVKLKSSSNFSVIGKPHGRVDALDIVTGRKTFAMDLKIPNALPTMVCRPPTINGKVIAVNNRAAVLAMPGVTHVATVPTGVAVRARTFGQCIDAVRALNVTWGPGPDAGQSDATILAKLKAAEIPMVVPSVPLGTTTINTDFTFWFASNSALETNAAVADVRAD